MEKSVRRVLVSEYEQGRKAFVYKEIAESEACKCSCYSIDFYEDGIKKLPLMMHGATLEQVENMAENWVLTGNIE
jgi:hypothetical protein